MGGVLRKSDGRRSGLVGRDEEVAIKEGEGDRARPCHVLSFLIARGWGVVYNWDYGGKTAEGPRLV